jgi:hypothetical protein
MPSDEVTENMRPTQNYPNDSGIQSTHAAPGRRLARFLIGLLILTGLTMFFFSGYTPPGVFGEVLRHNQEHQIDASPFFYGDVENMHEYEEAVKKLREKARDRLK